MSLFDGSHPTYAGISNQIVTSPMKKAEVGHEAAK